MDSLINSSSTSNEDDCSVCVAVHIRPLVPSEVENGCKPVVRCIPDQNQVELKSHSFSFNYVFGGGGLNTNLLYHKCVTPLVDALFKGYNATVLAYGQTGSGKTYTMGSEYRPGGSKQGVIPHFINDIFTRIKSNKDYACCIKASFVEIHNEDIRDLLVSSNSGPRNVVSIRETKEGGVSVYGAEEKEVGDADALAELLEQGALCRVTASTGMNRSSSRSHAIFTIKIEQRRVIQSTNVVDGNDDDGDEEDIAAPNMDDACMEDFLTAKMHLVDLAGSERAKRTRAEGARLREGIMINKGLLALGNVINAIVENSKHVPYRECKLTRMLQDSLGGNSRTVMIACVSPADVNCEETLNTLRYADRARHIRNKPIINRDPTAAQIAELKQQLAAAKTEILSLKRARRETPGMMDDEAERILDQVECEKRQLANENAALKAKLESMSGELSDMRQRYTVAQAELDFARASQSSSSDGKDDTAKQLMGKYVERITTLEGELKLMKQFQKYAAPLNRRKPKHAIEGATTPVANGRDPKSPIPSSPGLEPCMSGISPGMSSDVFVDACESHGTDALGLGSDYEDATDFEGASSAHAMDFKQAFVYAEEVKQRAEVERLQTTITDLIQQIQRKEEMALRIQSHAPAGTKAFYDKQIMELRSERDKLAGDISSLKKKLQQIETSSKEERARVEESLRSQLAQCERRVHALQAKESKCAEQSLLRARAETFCRRLENEMRMLKANKAAIQRQMEISAKSFNAWKSEREKEVLQLRKADRKKTLQVQQLEALNAKQAAINKRKTAEAEAARKRLKDLTELHRASRATHTSERHAATANGTGSAPAAHTSSLATGSSLASTLPATEGERRVWLERELDSCITPYDIRRALDAEVMKRKQLTHALKETEKRLMLAKDLVPQSPFLADHPSHTPLPKSHAAAVATLSDPAARERLEARQAQLSADLNSVNSQIQHLMEELERYKVEDVERWSSSVANASRWSGVRTLAEAREVLVAQFRLAVDFKELYMEAQQEACKASDELDLLRVRLDAKTKEAEASLQRAAALEVVAARVIASPYIVPPSPTSSHLDQASDRQDLAGLQISSEAVQEHEVAQLIQDLNRASESSDDASAIPESASPERQPSESLSFKADAEEAVAKALMFLSPLGKEQEPVEHAPETEATGGSGRDPKQSISNGGGSWASASSRALSPERAGITASGQMRHYPVAEVDSDEDCVERASVTGRESEGVIIIEDSETHDEEHSEVGDEDDEFDRDWDPSNSTPLVARGGGRRQTNRMSVKLDAMGIKIEKGRPPGWFRENSIIKSRAPSTDAPGKESFVLADINDCRVERGEGAVHKLTKKVLAEELLRFAIKAGSKNKEQLMDTYIKLRGLIYSSTAEPHIKLERNFSLPPAESAIPLHSPPLERCSSPSPSESPSHAARDEEGDSHHSSVSLTHHDSKRPWYSPSNAPGSSFTNDRSAVSRDQSYRSAKAGQDPSSATPCSARNRGMAPTSASMSFASGTSLVTSHPQHDLSLIRASTNSLPLAGLTPMKGGDSNLLASVDPDKLTPKTLEIMRGAAEARQRRDQHLQNLNKRKAAAGLWAAEPPTAATAHAHFAMSLRHSTDIAAAPTFSPKGLGKQTIQTQAHQAAYVAVGSKKMWR